MKVLVADACYVSSDKIFSVYFIRSRNIYYKKRNIDITVLDFSAIEDMVIDDIEVITLDSFKKKYKNIHFDILVSHAPNIKNHYVFLKKYHKQFTNFVFFFHGHEVLKVSKVYPKPYDYVKEYAWYNKILRDVYDVLKLKIWKHYFSKNINKSYFIFVSNWMYNEFLKWVKIDEKLIKNRMQITYNTVGKIFETNNYKYEKEKKYHFITIRGNLDGSKYCLDKVVKIAQKFPQYNFCVIGKGKFFRYNDKPTNIDWIEQHLDHQEVIEYLNNASCALMPTRTDAQGLMACEMATFGIPLITSDIPVCHEIFNEFKNVAYIKNEENEQNFNYIYTNLIHDYIFYKNEKYFEVNACEKEVKFFEKIMQEKVSD